MLHQSSRKYLENIWQAEDLCLEYMGPLAAAVGIYVINPASRKPRTLIGWWFWDEIGECK